MTGLKIWHARGQAQGAEPARRTIPRPSAAKKRAAVRLDDRPFAREPAPGDPRQALIFIFSAATAKRLLSGWAISPASFSIVSVDFDVSATSVSKLVRA